VERAFPRPLMRVNISDRSYTCSARGRAKNSARPGNHLRL